VQCVGDGVPGGCPFTWQPPCGQRVLYRLNCSPLNCWQRCTRGLLYLAAALRSNMRRADPPLRNSPPSPFPPAGSPLPAAPLLPGAPCQAVRGGTPQGDTQGPLPLLVLLPPPPPPPPPPLRPPLPPPAPPPPPPPLPPPPGLPGARGATGRRSAAASGPEPELPETPGPGPRGG